MNTELNIVYDTIEAVLEAIITKEDDWFSEGTKDLDDNISYTYIEDYSEWDAELSAELIIIWKENRYHFDRTGYRNISYERWTDNTWYNWE